MSNKEMSPEAKVNEIKQALSEINKNESSTTQHLHKVADLLSELKQDGEFKMLKDSEGNPYKSFETFCKETFGFSRIYAYRLMDAHGIQDLLEKQGLTTIKQPEHVLTMLKQAKLDDERLKEVWHKATGKDTDTIPSRNAVREAIGKKEAKEKNTKDVKIFDELYKLNLTASEKKALDAIKRKWESAHEEKAEAAEAADE